VDSSTRSRSWSKTADADIRLEPAEAEILALDANAFARALSDPAARTRYEQLAAAASEGSVPSSLVGALETMLELLFEKGRPSNRAILQSVFGRTPRGRQRSAAAHDVTRALTALRGQQLENLRLSAAPSGHTLIIETDRVRLTLEIDADGARVSSLEAG
jgi:hypothetical protein